MKYAKKTLLLFITLILTSACSLEVDFGNSDSESKKNKSYYVNHIFGDDAGKAERIDAPESGNNFDAEQEELLLKNISYYSVELTDEQKEVFMQIYKGMVDYKSSIEIDGEVLHKNDINDFITYITCVMPEIHQIVGSYGLYVDENQYVTSISFNYSRSMEQGENELFLLDQEAERIVKAAVNLPDFEKLKYFHDEIILRCNYDETAEDKYSAYGCLIEGKAVCEGYAKAFKFLCDKAGIPCIDVIGTVNDNGVIESHMWNMVKINQEWYHIDVTWDDPAGNVGSDFLKYDYFNINDAEILKDHTFCTNTYMQYPASVANEENYFIKKGLYVRQNDNVEEILSKAVESSLTANNKYVNVKFASKYLYDNTIAKYFSDDSEEFFKILNYVQQKYQIDFKSDTYNFLNNDQMLTITLELKL